MHVVYYFIVGSTWFVVQIFLYYSPLVPINHMNASVCISVRLLIGWPSSCSLHHGKSSSTGNLLEREDMSLPMPDYGLTARLLAQSLTQTRPRPYSMAGFAQVHTRTRVSIRRLFLYNFLLIRCTLALLFFYLYCNAYWNYLPVLGLLTCMIFILKEKFTQKWKFVPKSIWLCIYIQKHIDWYWLWSSKNTIYSKPVCTNCDLY